MLESRDEGCQKQHDRQPLTLSKHLPVRFRQFVVRLTERLEIVIESSEANDIEGGLSEVSRDVDLLSAGYHIFRLGRRRRSFDIVIFDHVDQFVLQLVRLVVKDGVHALCGKLRERRVQSSPLSPMGIAL